MRRFRHWPIKRKLTLVIMVTSGAALLLASVAIVTYDQITFRPATVERLTTLAKIIGANCAAAISFNDTADAEGTLRTLRARRDIVAACIYNTDGKVFARYARTPHELSLVPSAAEAWDHRFEGGDLILFQPIVRKNETLGTICLRMDLQEQRDRLRAITLIMLVFVAGSLVVALVLSRILQRVVSQPVLELADVAQRVTTARDYSLRAVKRSEDETGRLTDAFNQMLSQIQERDSALLHARDELEDRVQQRTAELTRASEGLRQAEEKYRTLVERLPAITYIAEFGPAGRWLYVSPQIETILGFTAQEWMADPELSARQIDPHDRELMRAEETRSRTSGDVLRTEYRMRARDGRVVWFRDEAIVVKDAAGQSQFMHGLMFDITERKQAEDALREAEAKYRTLVEQLPAITYTAEFGTEGKWLYVSPQIQTLLGYSPGELTTDPELWLRQMHPEDRERVIADEALSRETGLPMRTEYRLFSRFGTLVWFRDEAVVVKDDAGRPLYLHGVMFDSTDSKLAEEAIAEREKRFRDLFESSPDAIFVEDLEGKVLDANPAACRLHGMTREQLVSKHAADLVPPETREKVMQRAPKIASGELNHIESLNLAADGRVFPVSITSSRIDYLGKPAILLHVRDITPRRKAEHEAAEKAKELARVNKELARSNKELEHFAYIASHDLQEPLRMVASYTQLLAKRYAGKMDKDADEFIHYAVDGAHRMQQLINDLLSYARITTRGKLFETTDCSALLQRVLDNLKIAIEESHATITHDPMPTVIADLIQMTQLFQNLTGNAIKFRGDKPPRIHIGAQRKDNEWVFSIGDQGIGIPPEHFDRIFLIFSRLHTREEYPGTGIGLAVCRRIVERHGGNIWVESEPGKGSTFYFTIPDQGASPP